MKSSLKCPACGCKTLEYRILNVGLRHADPDAVWIQCENPRCPSKATADGAEGETEAKAYELLKAFVQAERNNV